MNNFNSFVVFDRIRCGWNYESESYKSDADEAR